MSTFTPIPRRSSFSPSSLLTPILSSIPFNPEDLVEPKDLGYGTLAVYRDGPRSVGTASLSSSESPMFDRPSRPIPSRPKYLGNGTWAVYRDSPRSDGTASLRSQSPMFHPNVASELPYSDLMRRVKSVFKTPKPSQPSSTRPLLTVRADPNQNPPRKKKTDCAHFDPNVASELFFDPRPNATHRRECIQDAQEPSQPSSTRPLTVYDTVYDMALAQVDGRKANRVMEKARYTQILADMRREEIWIRNRDPSRTQDLSK